MTEQKQPYLVETASPTPVEEYQFEPIKGYPMLQWKGKRPFRSTHYYPAQLREVHGPEVEGWRSKIFWGDNLQVMSHLLRQFRGQINLAYIDPPFDSKAQYKKQISVLGKAVENDQHGFEEKQYEDIWTNDEYLQFMFERLVLIRELLTDSGSVFVHCDWNRNYLIRCIMDEVFGPSNIVNEIVWRRKGGSALGSMTRLSTATDTIYWYSKGQNYCLNPIYVPASDDYLQTQFRHSEPDGRRFMVNVMRSPAPRPNLMYDYKGYKMPPNGWAVPYDTMRRLDEEGRLYFPDSKDKQIYKKIYLDEYPGFLANNLWSDISTLKGTNSEILGYPTQKPEELLERIIQLASHPDDMILDVFMGSGTTQAVAMKLGRRFIGADINLGAVQITTKRLIQVAQDLAAAPTAQQQAMAFSADLEDDEEEDEIEAPTAQAEPTVFYTGFEVYNVNHYDIFRNPVEAKDLLLAALEVDKLPAGNLYDGLLDGRMVKVMPVNRIATRADLNELITGFDYRAFEKRRADNPNQPVEKITLVCMGHEPDLAAQLKREVSPYLLDVQVVDILRDKQDLQFKRDAEARVTIAGGWLEVQAFYPMNLLQKLSLQKEHVEEWRELVESVMIDWNYDGAVLTPAVVDIPEKNELVVGRYRVPEDAGTVRVKITDLLSESWEGEVTHG